MIEVVGIIQLGATCPDNAWSTDLLSPTFEAWLTSLGRGIDQSPRPFFNQGSPKRQTNVSMLVGSYSPASLRFRSLPFLDHAPGGSRGLRVKHASLLYQVRADQRPERGLVPNVLYEQLFDFYNDAILRTGTSKHVL